MNITVGISEDIGLRDRMEDEYAVYDRPEFGFFSAEIFDGHGGREAARLASEMLTPHFLNSWLLEREKPIEDRRPDEEILRESYCAVDDYVAYRKITSGTTAATLYVMGDRFVAANAGDSRVIIGTDKGVSMLTLDHKPNVPEERSRIEHLGGSVTSFGVARVMGLLAVSRAIGDTELKPFVTCEPRVTVGLLGRENDYAVVACDGLWDVLKPETVIGLAREGETPQAGAEIIKNAALSKGSTDNISVLVLDLKAHTKKLRRKRMKILRVIDRTVPLQQHI